MDRSNNNGKETGQQQDHIQIFVWRRPKKNHGAMIQNCKRATSAHAEYGQRLEFFLLDRATLGSEYGLTNIATVIPSSARRDDEDEVWLEVNFHKPHTKTANIWRRSQYGGEWKTVKVQIQSENSSWVSLALAPV